MQAAHGTTCELQAACDGFFGLLHTGVIVSTSYTSEWPVTLVLSLRREETRIKCGFRPKKKTSCTVANGGVRRKKKLYDDCNA